MVTKWYIEFLPRHLTGQGTELQDSEILANYQTLGACLVFSTSGKDFKCMCTFLGIMNSEVVNSLHPTLASTPGQLMARTSPNYSTEFLIQTALVNGITKSDTQQREIDITLHFGLRIFLRTKPSHFCPFALTCVLKGS